MLVRDGKTRRGWVLVPYGLGTMYERCEIAVDMDVLFVANKLILLKILFQIHTIGDYTKPVYFPL